MGITAALQEMKNKSEPRFALTNYELGFRVRGLWHTKFLGKDLEFLWTLMWYNTLDDTMIVDDLDEYSNMTVSFHMNQGIQPHLQQ